MPKLTTPTNPIHGRKPRGAQMSAVSKAVLGLVNLHPNATTAQLLDAWANLANAPSDDSTHGPARRWLGPRINRLAGLGHVVNNKIVSGTGAMWHITALGIKTLGLEPPADNAKKRPAAPTTAQQQGMLAPRGSKIVLPKTPRTKHPASTATEAPAKAKAADTPKPAAIDPAKLSPREREIAMFASITSRVAGKDVPYTGIKSQLGSKGKASLYGPNSTVR